jgi:hypothetical protein
VGQPIEKERSVSKTSQVVVKCVVKQLLFIALSFCDVGKGTCHSNGLAVYIPHSETPRQHPTVDAIFVRYSMNVLEVLTRTGSMTHKLSSECLDVFGMYS